MNAAFFLAGKEKLNVFDAFVSASLATCGALCAISLLARITIG